MNYIVVIIFPMLNFPASVKKSKKSVFICFFHVSRLERSDKFPVVFLSSLFHA